MAAAFAPDGSTLAVAFADGRVELHALPYVPVTPARQVRPAGAAATAGLVFSPNSKLLAEISGGQVVLRLTADGTAAAVLDGCSVDTVRFSKTGDYLVGYNWGSAAEACIFSTTAGRLVGRIPAATSAAFRTSEGDGDTAVVAVGCMAHAGGYADGLCTYDRAGQETNRTLLDVASPTEISPLGDVVVSRLRLSQRDPVLGGFNAVNGALRWAMTLNLLEERPVFVPGGNLLLASEGEPKLIRLTDGQVSGLLAPELHLYGAVRAFSPDRRLVLLGDELVETETGAIRRVFGGGHYFGPSMSIGDVPSLAISGDGHLLVRLAGISTFAWRVASEFGQSEGAWEKNTGVMNVDVSPDGRLVVASGDERVVLDATNGLQRWFREPGTVVIPPDPCFYAQTRFSPDGRFLVGKGYRTTVGVFDTATFTEVAEIPTSSCAGGLAFSRDGNLVATSDPALFGVGDWKLLGQQPPPPPGLPQEQNSSSPRAISNIEVGPEGTGMLLTWCEGASPCRTFWRRDTDWSPLPPALDTLKPRFSAEGHWVVGGATLLHLPTGTVRSYFSGATAAIFAPNGDIIASDKEGNISRYCRHP